MFDMHQVICLCDSMSCSISILVALITMWLCVCPSDQMQGTVTLRNISTSTSGLYQCTSSNAIGKSTCLLNLQVVARKYAQTHGSFTAGSAGRCYRHTKTSWHMADCSRVYILQMGAPPSSHHPNTAFGNKVWNLLLEWRKRDEEENK